MDLHTLRQQYRDAILELAARHKLEDVRVFGSTARGEARLGSDLDILVHPKTGCSLLDVVGFEIELSSLLGGQKVDVVEDEAVHERLAPFIFAEAVRL